jgi:hypothetical protein
MDRAREGVHLMPRLYRPHIPLSVRCEVALRQMDHIKDILSLTAPVEPLRSRLDFLLEALARLLACEVSELRLDHDPPLGARSQAVKCPGFKGPPIIYIPDANDPEHLAYRPHGPQHDGSHLIKTNVRGDHGQHPDRVLIKKARRLRENKPPKRKVKITSRGFKSSGLRKRMNGIVEKR